MNEFGDDHDLIQAQGLAFALVGKLLERQQPIPPGEFSRYLTALAEVTRETNERQGAILAVWAELALSV